MTMVPMVDAISQAAGMVGLKDSIIHDCLEKRSHSFKRHVIWNTITKLAFLVTKTSLIKLTTKGLKLANSASRKDFRFVSGSDSFFCDRFQAAFLSPRVASLLLSDPTIDSFTLIHADCRSFELIDKMIVGDSVFVNEMNVGVFEGLIEDLDNSELIDSILSFIEDSEPQNIKTFISQMNHKVRFNIRPTRECELIASHFSEMTQEMIEKIDIETMKDILGMESLCISNEDDLFSLIIGLGKSYYELLGSVRFEYLRCDCHVR
jgi:hypothetical protein